MMADLFNFMEYSKARGRHDGRFTQIRLWIQFVLSKAVCLVLGVLDVLDIDIHFFCRTNFEITIWIDVRCIVWNFFSIIQSLPI